MRTDTGYGTVPSPFLGSLYRKLGVEPTKQRSVFFLVLRERLLRLLRRFRRLRSKKHVVDKGLKFSCSFGCHHVDVREDGERGRVSQRAFGAQAEAWVQAFVWEDCVCLPALRGFFFLRRVSASPMS